MRKSIKTIAGLTIMSAAISISNTYADNSQWVITATTLNIRSGPSTSYKVISREKKNTNVQIIEKGNSWHKIKLSNGKIGWGSAKYINSNKYSSSSDNSNQNHSEITNLVDQSSKVQAIVKKAHEQLGKPYVWGSEGPNSFDCSGLVHYVFGQNGIKTPRVSRDQYKVGKSVSKSNLQSGDLIFSNSDQNGRVTHVGIYVGDGKMIHAPNSKGVVKKVDINTSYWKNAYVGAKRIL